MARTHASYFTLQSVCSFVFMVKFIYVSWWLLADLQQNSYIDCLCVFSTIESEVCITIILKQLINLELWLSLNIENSSQVIYSILHTVSASFQARWSVSRTSLLTTTKYIFKASAANYIAGSAEVHLNWEMALQENMLLPWKATVGNKCLIKVPTLAGLDMTRFQTVFTKSPTLPEGHSNFKGSWNKSLNQY